MAICQCLDKWEIPNLRDNLLELGSHGFLFIVLKYFLESFKINRKTHVTLVAVSIMADVSKTSVFLLSPRHLN